MKRVTALLIVAVFCITIFSSSASAVCPDPNNLRFIRSDTPYGDDGSWVDVDSVGDKATIVIRILNGFKVYASKYIVVYFIPKKIENQVTLERNDFTNHTSIDRSRGASSK